MNLKDLNKAEAKVAASKKNGTYMGAKKLKSSLMKNGTSSKYVGALIGSIARKKYGAKGAAALSANARSKK